MRDPAASARARLQAWAKDRGIQFQYASLLYMHEGFLSRLARSPYAETFILKGGYLLFAHLGEAGRSTKDIDFLGRGISKDEATLSRAMTEIITSASDDGLSFDPRSLAGEPITEETDYQGLRLSVICRLGTLRNKLQIDIGFGDAIEPGAARIGIHRILGGADFEVSAYPLAAVIAEKFETMIALGQINSRMKDFYDVAFLLTRFGIPAEELRAAIKATFARRRTELPASPLLFTPSFHERPEVQTLWNGFLKRTNLPKTDFSWVIDDHHPMA